MTEGVRAQRATLVPGCWWGELLDWRLVGIFLLGFSAGLPFLLIFSSLSLWLREAGIERSAITLFSWAALGYSFKFVWAPLIDTLPLPYLSARLGRRRAWLLTAQIAIIAAIVLMALTDPAAGEGHLLRMAIGSVLLGFSAATQDIAIDAYRIESAPPRLQALMSSSYIAGYRVGMLVSGAGALFLAAAFGSELNAYSYPAWRLTYLIMAGLMGIGVVTTTLVIREPEVSQGLVSQGVREHLRLVLIFGAAIAAFASGFWGGGILLDGIRPAFAVPWLVGVAFEGLRLLAGLSSALLAAWLLVRVGVAERSMLKRIWIAPVLDFFRRYGLKTALLLLALIGLYRISDILLGVIANVFYQDLGFSKPQIATAVKTFGVFVGIAGGVLGGILAARYGVWRILMAGAILSAATNLIFIALAQMGPELGLLYLAVGADNLAGGLAGAAFVAFLSSLTNVSFTAMQYAIFSSLMTFIPKLIGGYTGAMVDGLGYPAFFVFTALAGLPVIALIWGAGRLLATK
ncbi:AmpG family muropeptide MFS transporter [Caldichromatium japonicum]|uniref:AmpG family muropeptide MFS transporter n=1 Tax=Caldichromatium japonicum TaxID=2699430 RepID=A0A6G7VA75_9GAMM|nr:MFS transporter [Caldichromatium japonicum]QIK36758.1 AmpG family muropeptide MFS transporter [Caldichromatium japonicum]